MAYQKPTYEEYLNATKFARFRYRFGVFIQFFSLLLFLILICYMIYHGEEVARNPLTYGADKYNTSCYCFSSGFQSAFSFNGSGIWIDDLRVPEQELNISNTSNISIK